MFKEIFESTKVTIYHGDNHNTKEIKPTQMDKGNMQNGPGIYFSEDITVAKLYGKNIVQVEVDPKKFIPSRGPVSKMKLGYYMLKDLWKVDKEAMYYLISDWIEVHEPDDVTIDDVALLFSKMKQNEIRNFLITLSDSFGVEELVKVWMKHYPNKLGTYDKNTGFYSVINTNLKLKENNV